VILRLDVLTLVGCKLLGVILAILVVIGLVLAILVLTIPVLVVCNLLAVILAILVVNDLILGTLITSQLFHQTLTIWALLRTHAVLTDVF